MVSIMMQAISAKKNPLKELFEVQIPLVFTLTELTWWKAILSKWFNVVVTFAWSFMDLFVIVVSVGLTSQFRQINADLQQMKGKVMTIQKNMGINKQTNFLLFSFFFFKAHVRRILDFATYSIPQSSSSVHGS